MNLLHEFLTREVNTPLDDTCSFEEAQSKAFDEWHSKLSFEKAARPLIKWLNDNGHPHKTIILHTTGAELLEGVTVISNITEYSKD